MRLSQQMGVVYVLKPGDHQAGATGDSINVGKYGHVTYLIQFAALTGDGVLTVKSGATAAVQTTAETFYWTLGTAVQGSAGADIFGTAAGAAGETEATTLTLTAATYANKALILEVPVDMVTDGQPWLTLAFSAAADALNASVFAILGMPRYAQEQPPTAIT